MRGIAPRWSIRMIGATKNAVGKLRPASRQIDQEVGFIKDALKFSYLLLRKDGRTIVERRPEIYRVVSELRELKGEKRAWLCNELGRSEVGRLDRLSSPENGGVDSWHRGAIVQIERIVRKEHGGKISALGRIERDAGCAGYSSRLTSPTTTEGSIRLLSGVVRGPSCPKMASRLGLPCL